MGQRLAGVITVIAAAALVSCGGGGGPAADDASDPAGGTATEPAAGGSATEGTAGDAAATPAAELPLFLADFNRVCTTQVGFSGAAPYNNEPGPHPVALFEEYDVDETLLETSRTLPKGWAIEQDLDFEDNSELAGVELIACSDRMNEKPNGTVCEFDSDGETVELELVDATYQLTVYEATTGAELGGKRLKVASTECPFAVSFEEGQTEYFNRPTDDQMINALKPHVTP